jgi:hypothetical protein
MLPPRLEFTGEFGAEINSFVPFVHWAWQAGRLERRPVVTYRGMLPFYRFLPPDQIIERDEPRRYVPPEARPEWLPTRDDHGPHARAFERFPDYRALFANDLFETEGKPILVLHNKFCTEWDRGPVNFLPPALLAELLAALTGRFRVFYSRPGIAPPGRDYSADHQPDHDLGERDILAAFPEVTVFEDLAAELEPVHSYNELKLMLYANSWFHLTTQGGNAHLAALFGGSLIAVYHRAGQETRYSYQHGHFAWAANPAPDLIVARDEAELLRTLPIFDQAVLREGRVHRA